MKNPFVLIGIVIILIAGFVVLRENGIFAPAEKAYIAVEGEGKIAVINTGRRSVMKNIDFTVEHEGGTIKFFPHNVQVAPDGSAVWVTANSGQHEGHSGNFLLPAAHAHGGGAGAEPDEVIVINPLTDRILRRIALDQGLQLAHVVVSPDGAYAYVSAQRANIIFKINAKTFEVEKKIPTPPGSEPHGLRISPDGKTLYVAFLTGKALGVVDLATDLLTKVDMPGQAVQVGVTPDGTTVFVSLFDTKQVALYRPATKTTVLLDLPSSSQGPIQMYPTPDSRFVYVADQGYYFGQPSSEWVYKIEVASGRLIKEIKAGSAPHGVVVSKDGAFVYITNLSSNDISVIDLTTDSEVSKILVGKDPNGISLWSKTLGGTP